MVFDSSTRRDPGLLAGAATVALIIGALALSFTSEPAFPVPGATSAGIQRFVAEAAGRGRAAGLLQAAAALTLLWFCCACARYLARRGAWSGLPLAAGTLAAAMLLIGATLDLAVLRPEMGSEAYESVHLLGFLIGAPAHVTFLGLFAGAVSLTALRTRALPQWLCVFGLLIAVPGTTSVLSLAWFEASPPMTLARFAAYIWLVAAGLSMFRGGGLNGGAGRG
ncbi:hypothetical protein [Microbispora sp. KK1-11]|uniref:hypothetical protein n=1 Tax=Microbispora sp. KK1-11 TaxID=2053005 RepID=UPI0011593A00|nr:hypothetical protein [Microbispora sp. KK1-11]TQS31190.1 hypothetical protein FLW16_02680 [Microbispora sp. KK1-11]